MLLRDRQLTPFIERDVAVATHPKIGRRLVGLVDGLLERLAGQESTPVETLRATAALGALRRPVLRLDLDVANMADKLVGVALCTFEG